MAIDKQSVCKVAFLSRLRIDEDKIFDTEKEFNKIIDWIEQLNEVDTDSVEPLVTVNDMNITCRKDEVGEHNQSDKILYNAPMAEYGYFVVPKVVE